MAKWTCHHNDGRRQTSAHKALGWATMTLRRKWPSWAEGMLQVTQESALLGGTEVGSEHRGSLGGRGEKAEEEVPGE